MATELRRRAGEAGYEDFTTVEGWELRQENEGRGPDPREGAEERLARGLGWFSIGLGLAQIGAPRSVARMIGVPDDEETRNAMFAIGLRELTSGIGILSRNNPAPWLWTRVAGDVMDLALLGKELNSTQTNRARVAAATAAVLSVTVLDLHTSRRMSRVGGNGRSSIAPAAKRRGFIEVRESITINRPVSEVYSFWKNFENLPRFMEHLESVQVTGERRSRWRTRAPAGNKVEWEAEITEDRPNELIAWRALPGADVPNMGRVRFLPAPGGRGTEVQVELRYEPPGGKLAALIAKLFGEEPGQQVRSDLRRFKQVMEAGEVLHSDSSIHSAPHPARPSNHEIPPGDRTGTGG